MPAICIAALMSEPDSFLLVLPSDHLILNREQFRESLELAIDFASKDKMVTFGILPTGPITGYGYIKRGSAIGKGFGVEAFVEKPELELAEKYFSSGNYYWNSGMFLFKADKYLQELEVLSGHTESL